MFQVGQKLWICCNRKRISIKYNSFFEQVEEDNSFEVGPYCLNLSYPFSQFGKAILSAAYLFFSSMPVTPDQRITIIVPQNLKMRLSSKLINSTATKIVLKMLPCHFNWHAIKHHVNCVLTMSIWSVFANFRVAYKCACILIIKSSAGSPAACFVERN